MILDQWNHLIHDRGLDPVSIRRKLAAVRSLFHFLAREGSVPVNVARLVRTPKTAKRVPLVPTAEQTNGLIDSVAATSVGIVDEELLLDLNYEEDSRAQVDMNVVMTGGCQFVEVQASAEGRPYTSQELQDLLDLASAGIEQLAEVQRELLHVKFRGRTR